MRTFIILILLFIIIIICISKKKVSKTKVHNKFNSGRIEECISDEDIKYQLSNAERKIIESIENSKYEINQTLIACSLNTNKSWQNSYKKILEVSGIIEYNLSYYSKSNLELSKFHYYTNLHFRSMIAANIVYREYKEINSNFEEINNFIVKTKNNKFNSTTKDSIYDTKNKLKSLRKIFLSRVRELNNNTGLLRDKIGIECGIKGKEWRGKIMKNRV